MTSFNDFVHKYKFKNKATSIIKIYEVLKKTGPDSKVGIFWRDANFSTNYGILNLHPSKGPHWVCYTKKCYFGSNGCPPPTKFRNYIKNKHGKCIYSEYQTQKNHSFCGSFCLYIICLIKVVGIDFKSAVLNLDYQMK